MLVRRAMVTLGFLAFAVTLLGGAVADNSLEFTVVRALWALLGFAALGAVLGWAADRVVREHRALQYQEVFGNPETSQAQESGKP